MKYFKMCLSKYATFQGRARRSEFWFFQLFYMIFSIGLQVIASILAVVSGSEGVAAFFGILLIAFYLALFLPSLSVLVRRLHDTDRSGWFVFISFIPLVGTIILLIWLCSEGTQGDNRFGSDPKLVS
ncbi:DUF805 domain-containing protein [Thorsellia anophelis]|uniref:Uncharacterized membrane protein YhaH, DUF805 family n=1 Tax=Thorsellia anophelis DSM 18579 TaxID=1123402 RepID=A0A1I0CU63_9GAMM|nr:DUF805 domain-containing protein [Thorsellia anophelis]SET23363.1 Uncharacterized membrane protein YhaH, DUF805 family [Thorsellia anophelis DSM 18579]